MTPADLDDLLTCHHGISHRALANRSLVTLRVERLAMLRAMRHRASERGWTLDGGDVIWVAWSRAPAGLLFVDIMGIWHPDRSVALEFARIIRPVLRGEPGATGNLIERAREMIHG
jgi:hypothetical protein